MIQHCVGYSRLEHYLCSPQQPQHSPMWLRTTRSSQGRSHSVIRILHLYPVALGRLTTPAWHCVLRPSCPTCSVHLTPLRPEPTVRTPNRDDRLVSWTALCVSARHIILRSNPPFDVICQIIPLPLFKRRVRPRRVTLRPIHWQFQRFLRLVIG